jgi:hypothetical protein
MVEDKELVNKALNGFSPQWETFVHEVCAQENLPSWKRPWDDYIQEEIWMESKGSRQRGDSDHALIGQTKKGRGKGPNKSKEKSEELASQPG